VTKIVAITNMTLVAPKAAAKLELLFKETVRFFKNIILCRKSFEAAALGT
jgi:hypothetical protein